MRIFWMHVLNSGGRFMKTCLLSLEEAYSVAVKGGNLRNGAIWMIPAVDEDVCTPRTVFLELPFKKAE